jgi:hypothetical protein
MYQSKNPNQFDGDTWQNFSKNNRPAGKDAHATCFTSHFGSNTFGGIQGEFKSLDFCWRLVPK